MKIALTGAAGFIASHILTDLHEHGHEVTALIRDEVQADAIAARGATAVVVDLYDRPAVVSQQRRVDGAVHTASPGDETSANLDSAARAPELSRVRDPPTFLRVFPTARRS